MLLVSSAWISRNECGNMLHIILEILLFTGFGEKHAVKGPMQCKAGSGRQAELTCALDRFAQGPVRSRLLSLGVFFASEKRI